MAQFVVSVAAGLTVVLLAFLSRTIRVFLREHRWLIEQVNKNVQAIEKQGEAIESLLEERRPPARTKR